MDTDYTQYLDMERRTLLSRYLCVERDLAKAKVDYGHVLSDEKRMKAQEYVAGVGRGLSPSSSDKAADHAAVHLVTETIEARVQIDVLERESTMILVLLRESVV